MTKKNKFYVTQNLSTAKLFLNNTANSVPDLPPGSWSCATVSLVGVMLLMCYRHWSLCSWVPVMLLSLGVQRFLSNGLIYKISTVSLHVLFWATYIPDLLHINTILHSEHIFHSNYLHDKWSFSITYLLVSLNAFFFTLPNKSRLTFVNFSENIRWTV